MSALVVRRITGPAAEPISLATAKLHCHAGDDEDAVLNILIAAARERAEHVLGRSLITQTWERVLDAFPADNGAIELPNPPILAIASVKYLEAVAGAETTLDSSSYVLDKDSEPGWLVPATDVEWPDTYDTVNAVRVRYTAGYDADGTLCPANIKHALLIGVAEGYRNREEGEIVDWKADGAFMALLQRHRLNLGL